MNIWRSVGGTVEVELTTADPEGIFTGLTELGISMEQFQQTGVLAYAFSLARRDYRKAAALCEKRGASLLIRKRTGLYWHIKKQLKRPAMYGGMFLLVLVFWLPTRVLFFSVSGNNTVAEKQILETAESCGVAFGASRKEVRSERVKNALLERLPQLQWVGVNTSGCHAVISVREKQLPKEDTEESFPANIVASRDGYVLSCTAEKGSLLVSPGQTVQKGQVLISGYTDCGLCVRAERAAGEILAQTNRSVACIMPRYRVGKLDTGQVKRKISLLLRKKRIFLWKDSGIWEGSCGRMYEEYYITLPGGFRLPAALCVEEFFPYQKSDVEVEQSEAEAALHAVGKEYLSGQMVAGKIAGGAVTVTKEAGVYRLVGEYTCLEMIGQHRQEQIGDTNGKDD